LGGRINSSDGIVFLGLARSRKSLEDGESTIAVRTLVNDSLKVVEISTAVIEVIEVSTTTVRGTIDVKDNLETTVVLDVFFSVEN